jgi:alkylation response protein AidB-like acyl-CoA dehydrogenase
LADFEREVRGWLANQDLPRRQRSAAREGEAAEWGAGVADYSVFDDDTDEQMRARIEAARNWQRRKFDAGYVSLDWDPARQRRFNELQAEYEVPWAGELPIVSVALIAPTIAAVGTEAQQGELVTPLLRMDTLACQLFSEPDAGSDLAGIRTAARADGEEWLVSGQKVWTSGARFADWGLAIARTDPESQRHRGLTAFLIPLDAAGVDVRPIRQITGGSSFNEVFLDEVRIPDTLRIGEVGAGWAVAMKVLSFERDHSSGAGHTVGGQFSDVLAAARHTGAVADPAIRDALADLYVHAQVEKLTNARVAAKARAGRPPGPEGSISKLLWTQNMTRVGEVARRVIGAGLIADSGEWGTFAWTAHLLGAPGYRIAGGTDEIQRSIIGERVLGLPRDR